MIEMNPGARQACANDCEKKLADKGYPDYMLRVRDERINIFFTEKLEGWISEIQKNSAKEKLGDLLEKVKGEVSRMWNVLSPSKRKDQETFSGLWGQKVQQIKAQLKARKLEKIQDPFLPPHIYNKYVSCGDDSVTSPRSLAKLKASWAKEVKREDEIQGLETLSNLPIENAQKLKQLYRTKHQYWSSFVGEEEKIQEIENRIEVLRKRIETLKKISDGLLPDEKKIQASCLMIKHYKDKQITGGEIIALLRLYKNLLEELGKFDESILTEDQKVLLKEAKIVPADIEAAKTLHQHELSFWSDDLSEGVETDFHITVGSVGTNSLYINPLVHFNYKVRWDIRNKARGFAASISQKKYTQTLEELIKDEGKKHFKGIKREEDNGTEKFFLKNLGKFTSFFMEEFKEAVSKNRTERNDLDCEGNRGNLRRMLSNSGFIGPKQDQIMKEYEETIVSFPNDFSVVNGLQVWDKFIDKIRTYKKFFNNIFSFLQTFKERLSIVDIPPEENNDSHKRKMFLEVLRENGKILYFIDCPFPEWVLDEIPTNIKFD